MNGGGWEWWLDLLEYPKSMHSFTEVLSTGTIRVWHANTYRLETTLNYGLERVWCIAHMRGFNDVCIGYDEGSVMIKVSELIGGGYKACGILWHIMIMYIY